MMQKNPLRSHIKALPVIGPAAKLANRFRISVLKMRHADIRRDALLRIKHRVFWYISRNPQSQKRFVKHCPILTVGQRELVDSLTTKGVAAATFTRAGIEVGDWSALQEKVAEFARLSADRITAATASYSERLDLGPLEHNRERFRRFFSDKSEAKLDDYILKMNPENSIHSSSHPLLTIGLSAPILRVVSTYMNLWPKLIYADAWYSIPMDPGKRIGSQQWHRDPEDKQMVKVYLYLSEIDEGAGAMEYILGTSNALGGQGMKIGEWKAAGANLYPPTELVEQSFSDAQHFYCTGPVVTLLFCDTTGLHRGGISRSRPRVVATWTFVTPASRYRRRFTVNPVQSKLLTEEARFALDVDN
ncbi:MAG: hypothetical protein ACRD3Q_11170 [Terriglobales bacterium]